jgi:hypothetical protein
MGLLLNPKTPSLGVSSAGGTPSVEKVMNHGRVFVPGTPMASPTPAAVHAVRLRSQTEDALGPLPGVRGFGPRT